MNRRTCVPARQCQHLHVPYQICYNFLENAKKYRRGDARQNPPEIPGANTPSAVRVYDVLFPSTAVEFVRGSKTSFWHYTDWSRYVGIPKWWTTHAIRTASEYIHMSAAMTTGIPYMLSWGDKKSQKQRTHAQCTRRPRPRRHRSLVNVQSALLLLLLLMAARCGARDYAGAYAPTPALVSTATPAAWLPPLGWSGGHDRTQHQHQHHWSGDTSARRCQRPARCKLARHALKTDGVIFFLSSDLLLSLYFSTT
jgi:hypothetical protein